MKPIKNYLAELYPYWLCIKSIFSRIHVRSEKGLLAFDRIVAVRYRGMNPITGIPVDIDFDPDEETGNQIIAFYQKEHKLWWVSVNSGYDWRLVLGEGFHKIVYTIDVVI